MEAEMALVPIGGFGRRDVAPFSDVDLMLLATPAAGQRAAQLARHLTRNICDAGLQLGFSLRTPDEACSLALKDPTIFTSLVESRFLAGHARVYERFLERFRHGRAAQVAVAGQLHRRRAKRRAASVWRDRLPAGAEYQAIARWPARCAERPVDRLHSLWRARTGKPRSDRRIAAGRSPATWCRPTSSCCGSAMNCTSMPARARIF